MEASTSSGANFQIPAISRIPLSVPSGYEVDLAISGFTSFLQSDTGSKVGSLPLISSLDGLGKLQSVEGMTIQKAFELMNKVKPIQDLVKRIVTKAEMWNVFINSNEVKEFERQLQTGANGPEAITSSNPQTQGISYSQHQSSGANIVVTSLSTNQQTHNNLSSQLRSSGANNVVRNPSISPQMYNTFYNQQQSSAQQESFEPGAWEKILLEFFRIGQTIFMAFKSLFQKDGGGGGGGGGCGCGHGGGGCEQPIDEYLEVAFLLSIVLMLGIRLIRFWVMGS
ncbi:hypothetical protein ACSBR1_017278 [Camellia fascicularis]